MRKGGEKFKLGGQTTEENQGTKLTPNPYVGTAGGVRQNYEWAPCQGFPASSPPVLCPPCVSREGFRLPVGIVVGIVVGIIDAGAHEFHIIDPAPGNARGEVGPHGGHVTDLANVLPSTDRTAGRDAADATAAPGPASWFHTAPLTARKSAPASISGAAFSTVTPPIATQGISMIADHQRNTSGSARCEARLVALSKKAPKAT